jgi:hypothetical protein
MGNFDSALQRIAERQKSRDPWHIASVLVGAIAGQVTKGFLIGIGHPLSRATHHRDFEVKS